MKRWEKKLNRAMGKEKLIIISNTTGNNIVCEGKAIYFLKDFWENRKSIKAGTQEKINYKSATKHFQG